MSALDRAGHLAVVPISERAAAYAPEETGWNRPWPECYDCKLRRELEAECFTDSTRRGVILTKLFWHARLMSPRLYAPPIGMWMDHTHYAHGLWRFYIDYAETLTGAENQHV